MVNYLRYYLFGGLLALALCACSTQDKRKPVYQHETFGAQTPYQEVFEATPNQACEAARRALLSQGYLLVNTEPTHLSANKAFQPEYELHVVIEFNVTCVQAGARALAFANALQVRYEMKKAASSASVGVSAIGSISLPIGNSSDSLVRAGSETITDKAFYERFFTLMLHYLEITPKPEPQINTQEDVTQNVHEVKPQVQEQTTVKPNQQVESEPAASKDVP